MCVCTVAVHMWLNVTSFTPVEAYVHSLKRLFPICCNIWIICVNKWQIFNCCFNELVLKSIWLDGNSDEKLKWCHQSLKHTKSKSTRAAICTILSFQHQFRNASILNSHITGFAMLGWDYNWPEVLNVWVFYEIIEAQEIVPIETLLKMYFIELFIEWQCYFTFDYSFLYLVLHFWFT